MFRYHKRWTQGQFLSRYQFFAGAVKVRDDSFNEYILAPHQVRTLGEHLAAELDAEAKKQAERIERERPAFQPVIDAYKPGIELKVVAGMLKCSVLTAWSKINAAKRRGFIK